jgi:tripartite-type tricarboxylate transporter receptor subunit TctC
MPLRRIAFAGIVLAVAGPGDAASPSPGQYPVRPIRVVIAQEAGSSIDTNIRVVAPLLSERLGRQLVIDNRPGAGGTLGMTIGAAAAPDGYTLVGVGSPQMIAPFVFSRLEYDVVRDFVPVARYIVSPNVFVVAPGFPVESVKAFIDHAKARRNELNLSTAGPGSASHLAGVYFNAVVGVEAVPVHYKGGGAAVIAVIGGEAQYLLTPMPAVMSHVRAGRLKALAVGGVARAPQLPQVPTLDEAGVPGFRSAGWTGLLMPRKVPKAYPALVAAKLGEVMQVAAVREQILNAGGEPGYLAGDAFGQFIRDDMARFGAAAKAANLARQ